MPGAPIFIELVDGSELVVAARTALANRVASAALRDVFLHTVDQLPEGSVGVAGLEVAGPLISHARRALRSR
jgi:hypothetical protein